MTAPEQHAPPVYACAAGAVVHVHAGSGLEPAVLLHTFLPPGAQDQLAAETVRVDVSGDGPTAGTVTVRVLADGRSFTWQLPVAPFVAALPGQPGDDGRMVLLALVDAEPAPGFWAEAVDCEHLAAELQLPVSDLADALRGRLTPWLAEDLEALLHDDAHERAVDRSPAQTLATAVLAHYRGDLLAEKASGDLVQALELAPAEFGRELAARLCAALVAALDEADAAQRAQVLERTGPFEEEVVRLLTTLPAALAGVEEGARSEVALALLLEGVDRADTVRAAVGLVARLARAALGPALEDVDVLRRLAMVDDAGLVRLGRLWVGLAGSLVRPASYDDEVVSALTLRVLAEGRPGERWLLDTAGALAELGGRLRGAGRLVAPVTALLEGPAEDGRIVSLLRASLPLARQLRRQGRLGPGQWLTVPAPVAVEALGRAHLDGLDREVVLDLLDEVVPDDVDGVDLLDGFVCATAQVLSGLEPTQEPGLRASQTAELLSAVPGGPRGARWLLVALLRAAPGHDPAAADLGAWLPAGHGADAERSATRAGRPGMLGAGLVCLDALASVLGEAADVTREELLAEILPSALEEHGLLDPPEDDGS